MQGYKVIKLKDIYNVLGEKDTKELLKDFKCEINKDVEDFIRNKALEFSKQGIAETYIIITSFKQRNELISGDCLLKLACDKIREVQDIIGGRFVFLECEDKPELRQFYENNGFVCFGKRSLERDERKTNSGEYLLQMLCDLSKE